MSIFDSINRTFKNIFVGSHKGDDFKLEPLKESKPVWENPLDSMPIANGDNKYAPPERRAELEAELNPRPEEEVAEWFSDKKEQPDESDVIEEEKTMHQKMYEMATARYNPFSLGGSENCDSDISCEVQKHSPWPGGSENFQTKKKQEFTPENDPYGGY